MIERTIIIVFDSLGVGELPDAAAFGDTGSNTLAHIAAAVGGLALPNLASLGLGRIIDIQGVPPVLRPQGSFGKMAEVSAGKDTTVGHWELMGVSSPRPLPVYPDGFPQELIDEFKRRTSLGVLGNRVASGTEIIQELGAEHQRTGWPIVYTSADSVWQIAAHEETIPRDRLYEICEASRAFLTGDHGVARVIARPFTGTPGNYTRTHWRKDFSIEPPSPTLLDFAVSQAIPVLAAGKIGEIFAGRGITESRHTSGNEETFDLVLEYMQRSAPAIIFANLVDFDMLWGHRNDPSGYAAGLRAADLRLPEVLEEMREGDLLIIVGDHGCDPTTPSTDHSREYIPLLMCGPQITKGLDLGVRPTFADVGRTIAGAMGLSVELEGRDLWELVRADIG